MKQTAEDRQYAIKFAVALQRHISRERNQGTSLTEIAARLGVTTSGLQKQLTGGTPSIRTIALAYERYGVSIPYGAIDVGRALSTKRKTKQLIQSEMQLLLPFEITAPPSSKRLLLVPVRNRVRRYRLELVIGMTG